MLPLLFVASLACHPPSLPPPEVAVEEERLPTLDAIRAAYKTGYRRAVSVSVSPHLAMLCRMVIPGVDAPYHTGQPDVQAEKTITVFVNEAAWPAMQQTGERSFPDGAIVVKEKSDGALGIMVKSTAASPSVSGGGGGVWTYAYVDAQGQVEEDQGALAHCAACHERGAAPEGVPLAEEMVLGPPRDAIFLSAQVP